MKIYHLLILLLPIYLSAKDQPPPVSKELSEKLHKDFQDNIDHYTDLVKKFPENVRIYSRRGDNYLFAGKFKEAVADYEKMIELDPSQDAPHWRLGIAYYYINDFEKGMKQFAKYHAYDAVDRENGVWKFFCQASFHNIEKAQKEMLPYTKFDRHPFPAIYDLLEGKEDVSPESILKAAEESKEPPQYKIRRYFFAHLYIGMWHEIQGNKEEALKHLYKAAANEFGQGTETYMWQVARLHYNELNKGTFRIPKENQKTKESK